ncbi:class II glutamine amidotransferase [Falsiroseomonas selenitidurans]|uniref:Class II glutamine amidotransferase n=1 Tax=Falsiroseomonas selenitidurans TaxID=2716335 RepID=A0ABX1E215_9PROT|nr:class II glutamine amidotransferase [Falsiroseomonas selenitidurans]NKC31056.1 class II glutamine amidotransferase [Falsiroseomonas selenitidurans]
MCRFLAYLGTPIFLSDLVCAPAHSLIHQSMHADEGKTPTNGDGFGLGWYGEREEPGLYREIRPAWSDENLRSLCAQVRSRLFFAHVRASTGTATTRANCHPFGLGRQMFMHNGQVGDYPRIKRRMEAMIPDGLYEHRLGTGDTEAIFLAAMADGLAEEPVGAMGRTLGRVMGLMRDAGSSQPLRFAAAHSDGTALTCFRWASDDRPPSLYWRRVADSVLVVSEPVDERSAGWQKLAPNHVLVARPGAAVEVRPFGVLSDM